MHLQALSEYKMTVFIELYVLLTEIPIGWWFTPFPKFIKTILWQQI